MKLSELAGPRASSQMPSGGIWEGRGHLGGQSAPGWQVLSPMASYPHGGNSGARPGGPCPAQSGSALVGRAGRVIRLKLAVCWEWRVWGDLWRSLIQVFTGTDIALPSWLWWLPPCDGRPMSHPLGASTPGCQRRGPGGTASVLQRAGPAHRRSWISSTPALARSSQLCSHPSPIALFQR